MSRRLFESEKEYHEREYGAGQKAAKEAFESPAPCADIGQSIFSSDAFKAGVTCSRRGMTFQLKGRTK